MTSPLGSFVAIRLTATVNTPPEQTVYDGRILYLPPEYLTALGSGPGNPGALVFGDVTIRGWQEASGPTGHQWYMEPPFTASVRTAFNAIPGAPGWKSPTSRTTYRSAILALMDAPYSMPAADAVTLMTNLYAAAVADHDFVPAGG